MAKKQIVYLADGSTLGMTPNQFMAWKMKTLHASLICRLGHYSLGYKGINWSDARLRFEGTATELAVMREYEDLGAEDYAEQFERCEPKLKPYCIAHARDQLAGTYRVEKALDDLGNHPLDKELRAEAAAVRASLEPFLNGVVRAFLNGIPSTQER
jgi:hypothetical protein